MSYFLLNEYLAKRKNLFCDNSYSEDVVRDLYSDMMN